MDNLLLQHISISYFGQLETVSDRNMHINRLSDELVFIIQYN